MWIYREISPLLSQFNGFYAQILLGPRQCGKSSLFSHIGQKDLVTAKEIYFDDLQQRSLAQSDPALFLQLNPAPVILDEVQYAPELFPQIKLNIDALKRKVGKSDSAGRLIDGIYYRLTGSNLILLKKNVWETLVGRAEYLYLNTLSVSEIVNAFPEIGSHQIMYKGGFPELYTNIHLDPIRFLNSYLESYVQKDVAASAGIIKIESFNRVLRLLAARVGQLLNVSSLGKDAGVKSVTVMDWISILEQSHLGYLLRPFSSNSNNRLIKSPKFYFFDSGLLTRLQGWGEMDPFLNSPQVGSAFENLVCSELLKFIQNYGLNWKLCYWRNKEGDEMDFIIEMGPQKYLAIECKWSLNPSIQKIPEKLQKDIPHLKNLWVVVPGGELKQLSGNCLQIPITMLSKYLKDLISY